MEVMEQNLEKVFEFLKKVEKLKSTLRYNQLTSGRKESTAEHSWRVSLMVFMMADDLKLDIDTNKAVKIALVHDLAEAVVGDIDMVEIAKGRITVEEKQRREREGILELKKSLPEEQGNEMYELWNEYEENKTEEAKYVKALDKIECLTQLAESGYETYDEPQLIAQYADKAVLAFPKLLPMLKVAKKRLKEEFLKGKLAWKAEYEAV